jgi:glycosyltransferase involved in cell wall biosynthesis
MSETSPAVSIIIPCRNEASFIHRCLESVMAFGPPEGGFEVLVVDGMSTDGTADEVKRWAEVHSNLSVLENPGRIVPTALNLGVRAARGDLIVRLDAHSQYPANYLLQCVAASVRTGAANVGGLVDTVPRDQTRQARLVHAITTHRFGVGNSGFRIGAGEGPADTVPFGCFRRSVFAEIGYFDERLVRNQDYEFNRRIIASGKQVWRTPEIQVKYFNQGRIGGLLSQGLNTGKWNAWMWYLAPYTFSFRHAIPCLFVLALAMLLLGSLLSPLCLAAFLSLLGIHLLVGTVAGLAQGSRHGHWMVPLLPFVFLAYHLSYGLGTVLGAILLVLGRTPVSAPAEPWIGAGVRRVDPLGMSGS